MRELDVARITEAVAKLAVEACTYLGDDLVAFFEKAAEREESETGKDILAQLLENADLARDTNMPLCQDTGLAVVFLEIGQDVHLTGGDLEAAVNEGVRKGYGDGYLRKSAVADPIGAAGQHRRQHAGHASHPHRPGRQGARSPWRPRAAAPRT